MGFERGPADPELGTGVLYSVDNNGELKAHVDNLDISNGIAWSRDNKTMFFIDSIPRKVFAFDFDLERGEISTPDHAIKDILRFSIHMIVTRQ